MFPILATGLPSVGLLRNRSQVRSGVVVRIAINMVNLSWVAGFKAKDSSALVAIGPGCATAINTWSVILGIQRFHVLFLFCH